MSGLLADRVSVHAAPGGFLPPARAAAGAAFAVWCDLLACASVAIALACAPLFIAILLRRYREAAL